MAGRPWMFWLSLTLAAVPAAASAQLADPVAGRALAQRYCANCHLIGEGQAKPQGTTDSVPTFRGIANNPAIGEQRLKGFMTVPHPMMPDLNLTRREVDDIAAYIRSMKDR